VREEQPLLRGLRLTVVQRTEKPVLPALPASRNPARPVTKRQAYFEGRFVPTPVFSGPALRAGQRVRGPAIIEEPFTTIVLHPGDTAVLDRAGNYRIDVAL
jgi:N-methylhydantoinase A